VNRKRLRTQSRTNSEANGIAHTNQGRRLDAAVAAAPPVRAVSGSGSVIPAAACSPPADVFRWFPP
jgi:hypothetical protein